MKTIAIFLTSILVTSMLAGLLCVTNEMLINHEATIEPFMSVKGMNTLSILGLFGFFSSALGLLVLLMIDTFND